MGTWATSRRVVSALVLLLAILLAPGAQAGRAESGKELRIRAVVLAGDAREAEIALVVSRAVSFDAAVTRRPYRLEINLPRERVRLVDPRIRGNASLIAGVSLVRDAKASRLIFRLRGPSLIAEAHAETSRGKKPARLVVRLRRTDARTLARMLGETMTEEKRSSAIHDDAPDEALEKVKAAYRKLIEQAAALTSIDDLINAMPVPFAADEPDSSESAHMSADHRQGIEIPAAGADSKSGTALSATAAPVVVIDPGHGGRDPGALGPDGVMEKHLVLEFAQALRRALEAKGYRVVMTRNSDTFPRLQERVAFARQHHAALFISIHADKFHNNKVGGLGIYALSEKASDAEAADLARRENAAVLIGSPVETIRDDSVRDILVDLARRETNANSKLLAFRLARALRGVTPLRRNPVRFARYVVLRMVEIPSLLIELGYVTNPRDVKDMRSRSWRQRVARRMAQTIDDFLKVRIARR